MKKLLCILAALLLLASCTAKEPAAEIEIEQNPGESCSLPGDASGAGETKEIYIGPEMLTFNILAVENNGESSPIELSEEEVKAFFAAAEYESWSENTADRSFTAENIPVITLWSEKEEYLRVMSFENDTYITIGNDKISRSYSAPKAAAQKTAAFGEDIIKDRFEKGVFPAIENFDKLLVCSDDNGSIFANLSEEQMAELVSILDRENWQEYDATKEGGELSSPIRFAFGAKGAMYIGEDFYGDETVIIKWNGSKTLSKVYTLPEGTVAAVNDFGKRVKLAIPSPLNYPECDYEMSAEAFLNRENDKYLEGMALRMDCLGWLQEGGFSGYKGYSSAAELDSGALFNVFMFNFDEAFGAEEANLAKLKWLWQDGLYHISLADIHAVLGKYFEGYSFDVEEISVNFEYDEETDCIVIAGGYGVYNQWYGEREIVSVTDNGDGTLTAVIDQRAYIIDEETDSMSLSKEPTARHTLVFRPEENACICLSYKNEKLG